jgi:hypothetical protein
VDYKQPAPVRIIHDGSRCRTLLTATRAASGANLGRDYLPTVHAKGRKRHRVNNQKYDSVSAHILFDLTHEGEEVGGAVQGKVEV